MNALFHVLHITKMPELACLYTPTFIVAHVDFGSEDLLQIIRRERFAFEEGQWEVVALAGEPMEIDAANAHVLKLAMDANVLCEPLHQPIPTPEWIDFKPVDLKAHFPALP